MWAIANPAMHNSLAAERRWSSGDYERWLADVLTCSLLSIDRR